MIRRFFNSLVSAAVAVATLAGVSAPAFAHGERAQEPYLRTRTVQWMDVKWTKDKLTVNEQMTITGRFRLMEDWPDAIAKPDTVFLSVTSPGPAFARIESYINGIPSRQSTRPLELGREYEFSITLAGRVPGRHHIHPMISVHTAGPLVGPGKWLEVSGNLADFKYPAKTIDGRTIDDLQTWGLATAYKWHLIWFAIAVVWLLWWIARPLLLPRWIVLRKDREDLLVRRSDMVMGALMGIVVIGLAAFGYVGVLRAYPYMVPLQSGRVTVPPLPQEAPATEVKFLNATYDVPGRSLTVTFRVTNKTDAPLYLGEFTTANLRFIDNSVEAAVKSVDADYPKELIAQSGLNTSAPGPLAPGETKEITISATDAAWELERLTSFLTDVDSSMGGLLIFYDDAGKRHVNEVSGSILPIFKSL